MVKKMPKKLTELDKLERKLEHAFKNAMNEFARKEQTKIEKQFEYCVKLFYDSYSPKKYKRTYSTYYLSDKYGVPISELNKTEMVGENSYLSGITLSDDNIVKHHGHPYTSWANGETIDTDFVTNRTMFYGLHGYMYRQAYMINRRIKQDKNKEKKYKYKTKKDSSGNRISETYYYKMPLNKNMERLSPSPNARMKKWFKLNTRKKVLQLDFNECFNKQLKKI